MSGVLWFVASWLKREIVSSASGLSFMSQFTGDAFENEPALMISNRRVPGSGTIPAMLLFAFRIVEVRAGREILVAAKVFGAERLGDFVFLGEPLAEIDEFAAFRAKRAELCFEPRSAFLAGGAGHYGCRAHAPR